MDVILDGNVINAANPLQVDMGALSSLITGSGLPVSMPNPIGVAVAPYVGRVVVTKSGTPAAGGNVPSNGGFIIKALPGNTGNIYIWGIGQTKADSFILTAGQALILPVANLNLMLFDADVTSEGVCWSKGY